MAIRVSLERFGPRAGGGGLKESGGGGFDEAKRASGGGGGGMLGPLIGGGSRASWFVEYVGADVSTGFDTSGAGPSAAGIPGTSDWFFSAEGLAKVGC